MSEYRLDNEVVNVVIDLGVKQVDVQVIVSCYCPDINDVAPFDFTIESVIGDYGEMDILIDTFGKDYWCTAVYEAMSFD